MVQLFVPMAKLGFLARNVVVLSFASMGGEAISVLNVMELLFVSMESRNVFVHHVKETPPVAMA